MNQKSLIGLLLVYANRLKFKNLFLITLGLFIFDLLIPDFIPMIDEIILGLLTLILANWKKDTVPDRQDEQRGNVIEGEVIKDNKD